MGLLYTKFKIFHYKDKVDSLPREACTIKPPIHIRIKPTNFCAHNCWYCAYKAGDLQLGQDMSEKDSIPKEKMMEIIDDMIEMNVKAVTFSGGGDPFYYPHLLEAVKKLSQSTVQFAALTNGAKLKGELAEVIAHHGTWLRISIDGWDDASYAEYRGIKQGGFTKLMNNIKNFKKLGGKCFLGVHIVVDRKNASHIFNLTKNLKEVGVNSVKVSACIVSNDVTENNSYQKPVFVEVKNQLSRIAEELADHNFELFDTYHNLDGKFIKEYTWCPYLQILPVIGADLNIYSCQDKAYNLSNGLIGSIKQQRFRDFWFSDKNNFFAINPSLHCNHHCVANEKNKMLIDYLNADEEHSAFV